VTEIERRTSSIFPAVPDAQHDDALIAHRVADYIVAGGHQFPNIGRSSTAWPSSG
jgi:hypothetical protein